MEKQPLVNRIALTLFGVAAFAASPSAARAEPLCGSTSAGWNAPPGAAVLIVGAHGDVVHDLLAALGESRSHSMISHGPGTWTTHATSTTPPSQQDCSYPIDNNFLAASTPGLETIDQGAAYTFVYKGGPQAVYFQRPTTWSGSYHVPLPYPQGSTQTYSTNTGPLIAATYLGTDEWSDQMTYRTMGSGSNTVYGLSFEFNDGGSLWPAQPIYYGWHQYMNIGNTAQGYPTYQGTGWGVVCSTSLAMWQHDDLYNQQGYTGDVLPRQYTPAATTAAAWVLWNFVNSQASGATTITDVSNFFSNFGPALWSGTACAGQSVSNNAANQMVNAFATGNVRDNSQSDWLNLVQSTGAYSISPDDIGGWNSNGTGAPWSGTGSSVWGWDGNNTLQWNSPGNSYGCWAQ
jgi:hypothetical protein